MGGEPSACCVTLEAAIYIEMIAPFRWRGAIFLLFVSILQYLRGPLF